MNETNLSGLTNRVVISVVSGKLVDIFDILVAYLLLSFPVCEIPIAVFLTSELEKLGTVNVGAYC